MRFQYFLDVSKSHILIRGSILVQTLRWKNRAENVSQQSRTTIYHNSPIANVNHFPGYPHIIIFSRPAFESVNGGKKKIVQSCSQTGVIASLESLSKGNMLERLRFAKEEKHKPVPVFVSRDFAAPVCDARSIVEASGVT